MPKIPILMPQLGESIAEATIVCFLVEAGETIAVDQELVEVETSKATMGIPSLCEGKLLEWNGQLNESYPVGSVLGYLEVTQEEANRTGVTGIDDKDESSTCVDADSAEPTALENQEIEPHVTGLPVPAAAKGVHYISPRLRARMDELGLRESDISAVVGTGKGGRVTVDNLEKFLNEVESWPRERASKMRLMVSDAMRRSWTRPLASVGTKIDIEKVSSHRSSQKIKPSFTLYFLRAFAKSLEENPSFAGCLVGESIIQPKAIDLGIAVQVKDGVVVPILRRVNQFSLTELLDEYSNLIRAAKERRLSEDQTKEGIGTITNYGIFNIHWATPIPLPHETLILGVGASQKQPVWNKSTNQFDAVLQTDISMTFDHRVVDGGDAGQLLSRLAHWLQNPEEL